MQTEYSVVKNTLINAPIPVQTSTYRPISHAQLIDLTLGGIDKAGFTLDKEVYSSARDGNVANGKFSINNVKDNEMQLQIAWQNSYDRSLSLKFAIGTRVFICSNGMVSGDMGAFRKIHKGGIQTFAPHAISEYIKYAADHFTNMQKERESMKQVELSMRTKSELLGRMFIENKIITSTQLNIINRELQAPTHDYNSPDSLWELYNYSTFALKESHPANWMDSHIDVHKFFVDATGELGMLPLLNTNAIPQLEEDNDYMFEQLALEFPEAVILE